MICAEAVENYYQARGKGIVPFPSQSMLDQRRAAERLG